MYRIFKLTTYTAVLVTFLGLFASAQSGDLLEGNLHRYSSLKYVLKCRAGHQDALYFTLNTESVQKKVDDYFRSNSIACERVTALAQLPCLVIDVAKPVVGGSCGFGRPPSQLCEVTFSVFDKLAGTNVIVWSYKTTFLIFSNGLDALANKYLETISGCLNSFGDAWAASHSNFGTRQSVYYKNEDSLKTFIYSHINWSALPDITGKSVHVMLNISGNEKGVIDSVKLVTPPNKVFDVEAVRVVKSIPYWQVYYDKGKFVRNTTLVYVFFNEANKNKYLPPPPADPNKVETSLYTIDKTRADWKVTFKKSITISLDDKAGKTLVVHNMTPGWDDVLILKPGQYVEEQTGENVLGVATWKVISGLDRR